MDDKIDQMNNGKRGGPEAQHLLGEMDLKAQERKRVLSAAAFMRAFIVVAACVSWMAISSALIMVNKYLMSVDGFHYPMALSGLGMLFSSVASYLCCRVFKVVEAKKQVTGKFYVTRILPVGFFMALTLHFGNVVYLYLTVSFIQMLKAFTPVITMLALFIAGLEAPNQRLIASILLIALGTAMASYGEVNFSVFGVACMLLSESFEATRLVMTQMLLVGLKFNPIEGLMYLAPACSMWLALGVVCLELKTMLAEGAFLLMMNKPLIYLVAAAMGFGVNALAYIVIQLASSLTLKVLGTVKNAIVVFFGMFFFAEVVTVLQGVGYSVSLGGFFLYNYIKMNPIKAPEEKGNEKEGANGAAG